MSNGIADYLLEFNLDGTQNVGSSRPSKPIVPPHEERRDETAELIRAAEAQARKEERQIAEQTLAAALASERRQAEEKLLRERSRWIQEAAEKLSSDLRQGLQALEEKLSKSVARILVPFLSDILREQVLAELSQTLRSLLADDRVGKVSITGPEELLAALQQLLANEGSAFDYIIDEDSEIRVTADETILETQLKTWIGRMADAVKSS